MSDDGNRVARRDLLRGMGAGVGVAALAAVAEAERAIAEGERAAGQTDPHTADTFAALVDVVVPETPGLAIQLGDEHEPGGLAIGLDEFLVTYVNTLFQHGVEGVGHVGDIRLSEALTEVLDATSTELLARDLNEHPPGEYAPQGEDWSAGGPFVRLHPEDRVRAMALLDEDEKDWSSAPLPGPVAEGDAGLFVQLAVSFTEVVYYSEWQGYPPGEGITAPPSERPDRIAPSDVQSWSQTGFPGIATGHSALRGYASKEGSSLGGGNRWKTIETVDGSTMEADGTEEHPSENTDHPFHLTVIAERIPLSDTDDDGDGPDRRELNLLLEPGHFRENQWDTSGYEEVYPESEDASFPDDGADEDVTANVSVEVEHGPIEGGANISVDLDDDTVDPRSGGDF